MCSVIRRGDRFRNRGMCISVEYHCSPFFRAVEARQDGSNDRRKWIKTRSLI